MQTNTKANWLYRLPWKINACLIMICLAEWFFFNEYGDAGSIVGVYSFILLSLTIIANIRSIKTRIDHFLILLALGQTIAMINYPGIINIILFVILASAIALTGKINFYDIKASFIRIIIYVMLRGWFRFIRDALLIIKLCFLNRKGRLLINIFLPVSMTLAFVLLFINANPVLERWVNDIRFEFDIIKVFKLSRILFYLMIGSICWALIRPKLKPASVKPPKKTIATSIIDILFNKNAILSSLIMFNFIFFLQNIMDVVFIWSGVKLPDSYTYSEYARSGAYPLIFTALLAAWFVLIALKAGSESAKSKTIRILTYIWVSQNIFMLFSAMTRLHGYIEQYSLTYMRLSAFIWMGIIAVGLILIVIRIYANKSNLWLINSNLISLFLILYVCSMIGWGSVIARFNVESYKEQAARGKTLDINYLCYNVGNEALPFLISLNKELKDCGRYYGVEISGSMVQDLKNSLIRNNQNWRNWTYRDHMIIQNMRDRGAL